jgi:serine/threonine-protein kinase RsbW
MVPVERTFSLHVPSSTENLVMIREFVTSIGEQAGLPPAEIMKLETAVDEACSNVIEHAYGSDVTKEVSVRATLDDQILEITVTDTGIGFDPSTVEQKGLDKLMRGRKSGGLGMLLMRKFMDTVDYSISSDRNELRMVKRLKKE